MGGKGLSGLLFLHYQPQRPSHGLPGLEDKIGARLPTHPCFFCAPAIGRGGRGATCIAEGLPRCRDSGELSLAVQAQISTAVLPPSSRPGGMQAGSSLPEQEGPLAMSKERLAGAGCRWTAGPREAGSLRHRSPMGESHHLHPSGFRPRHREWVADSCPASAA